MRCACFFCRAVRRPELFEARDLLESKYGTGFVAQKTGLSLESVRKLKHELGLQVGRYTKFATVERRVADMVGQRMSFTEIADTLSISRETVATYFPGEGFTRAEQAERSRLAAFERSLNL